MEMLKKVFRGLAAGIFLGAVLRGLIPGISVGFILTLVVLLVVLNLIFEYLEKDSALKRYAKWAAMTAVSALIVIGLRLILGQLFNWPLAGPYPSIFGFTLSGIGAEEKIRLAALEFAFILPGIGVGYLWYTDEKWRKWIYLGSCVAFLALVWQVRQPANSYSVGVRTQLALDSYTQNNMAKTKAVIVKMAAVWHGELEGDGRNFKVIGLMKNQNGQPWLPLTVGTEVMFGEKSPVIYRGILYRHIRLQEQSLVLAEGVMDNAKWQIYDNLWVEADRVETAKPVDPTLMAQSARPMSSAPEAIKVRFEPGQFTRTGIFVRKGEKIRFLNPTAPFWEESKKYLISNSAIYDSNGTGELCVYGHQSSGEVAIQIVR